MNRRLRSLITKLALIIVCLAVVPQETHAQDKGAKNEKSQKGGKKVKGNKRGNYRSRKKASKKHWKNQDKATRKRMKRAQKNALRRQKGKPMKNNRLV